MSVEQLLQHRGDGLPLPVHPDAVALDHGHAGVKIHDQPRQPVGLAVDGGSKHITGDDGMAGPAAGDQRQKRFGECSNVASGGERLWGSDASSNPRCLRIFSITSDLLNAICNKFPVAPSSCTS